MPRIALLLVAMFAVMLGGCERTESEDSTASSTSPVQVVRADFGIFKTSENGRRVFVPSKTVPLTVGQPYGWVVTLKTSRRKIKWREELTLPSAPASWGSTSQGKSVSPDQKVSVLEREVEPANGVIFNAWFVAAGDPRGRYVIRLAIENASPMVFEFDVE